VSQSNPATGFRGTLQIEIGADKRRAAQRSKNATLFGGFSRHGSADRSPDAGGFGVIPCQALCKGTDQLPIAIEAENFESGHATFTEAVAIILKRALL
jgi:hypothetical protein